MSNLQKEAFLNFEADQWFNRNIEAMNKFNSSEDVVCQLVKKYSLAANKVLEIGSSSGHRLNGLYEMLGEGAQFYGIDPSKKAIEFGLERYLNINLTTGTADNLCMFESNSIDLVIVGFVFYVVDRNLLLKVISEIDRVLSENGKLIIVDFFSEIPKKNKYHHIHNFEAFSYKQNYHEIFISTKMYCLIDFVTQSHTSNNLIPDLLDYNELFTCSLLKKNLDAGYK